MLSEFCDDNTPIHLMTTLRFRTGFETSIESKVQTVFFRTNSACS